MNTENNKKKEGDVGGRKERRKKEGETDRKLIQRKNKQIPSRVQKEVKFVNIIKNRCSALKILFKT